MQAKLAEAAKIYNKAQIPSLPEELIRLKEELNKKYPNTVTIANLSSRQCCWAR